MLTFLARWRHGPLVVAVLVLMSGFASGRAQAHAPAMRQSAGFSAESTRTIQHCHQSDAAKQAEQNDSCKTLCAIGSQDRLTGPTLAVPLPSAKIQFGITPLINRTDRAFFGARIFSAASAPPPQRRLHRNRLLLI